MSQIIRHNKINKFWKDPKAILGLTITILSATFWCGRYFQKTESNLEIIKIRGEYINIINEERNKRILEACRYENEITLLKQKYEGR